jgi:hypothetical protein
VPQESFRQDAGGNWGYLKPSGPTLPELMKQAGYHTGMVGKWHLGYDSPNLPNDRGFDHFHGFLGDMMNDYYTHLRGAVNWMRLNKETIKAEGHATEVFSRWAIDYLEEQTKPPDQPFFLYLAYNAPHFPIQPPKAWKEKVLERESGIDPKRAANVAFVEHLDRRSERISNLRSNGLRLHPATAPPVGQIKMAPDPEVFYCPSPIASIVAYFGRSFPDDGTLTHRRGYFKNIAYTIQYLEYLDHTLNETTLHSTVRSLTQKSFIIGGMGVIESVLWYVLKKDGAHKTELWKVAHEVKSSEFSDSGKKRRLRTIIDDKLEPPQEAEMTLESMCKRVERRQLLGVKTQVYRDLNHLRSLRNRVHIHSVRHERDTDWWNFSNEDVDLMKKALHSVLTCSLFASGSSHIDILEFLKSS